VPSQRKQEIVTKPGTLALCLSQVFWIAAGIAFTGLPAAAQPSNEVRFVPDVVGQFNALSVRPDPMGWDIGKYQQDETMPDPTLCRHYEGIARVQGADGTPYFFFTRSGLNAGVPVVCSGPHEPGNLVVVRMGSREKHSERLRSNRLRKGRDFSDTPSDPLCDDEYPTCLLDVAVKHFDFNGAGGWPHYGHPESMQTLGNILVVGVDSPLGDETQPMQVLFIDVADPENPRIVNRFLPADTAINGGIVAITPLANGRYLLAITGAKDSDGVFNKKIYFFESLPTEGCAGGCTDLTRTGLAWQEWDTWDSEASSDSAYLEQSWPTAQGREHQMFQFLRQGDINGTLYLAGARGGISILDAIRIGDDILDLYRIDFIGCEGPGCDIRLKLVSSTKKHSNPNLEPGLRTTGPGSAVLGEGVANFAAASTFYVSPGGELLFYASEHQNSGPGVTVKMGEWRHRDMARPGSPTFLPGAKFLGPYSIPEGVESFLGGQGQQPVTKAWIQLFDKTDFEGHDGRYLVADFLDWNKDDFDDFKQFEGSPVDLHRGFNDEASSWRWFAPVGCSVRANDNHIGADSFPGDRTRTLIGVGQSRSDANLGNVRADFPSSDNMDGVVTSVQFLKAGTANDDCDYYSYRPDLFWDLDRNGSYATTGNIVVFNGAELDGPSVFEIPIKAVHPTDGLTGLTSFKLQVLNVAPTIIAWGVFNSLNQQLGVDVPYFLERLPVTVRGSFTDPGKPDHQTAGIQWGDGAIDLSNGFATFSDAFGGVVGQLSQSHRYASAGTYSLSLVVTDDDGDTDAEQAQIPILTVKQALNQIIEQLKQLIANTTNPIIRGLLEGARRPLEGAIADLSQNGADGQLELPTVQAALAKVYQALNALQAAQAAGADVATLIALVQQAAASLEAA
jgi:hypothetical protein